MAVEIHEEILVTMKNEPGALAKVLKTIGDAGVNVLAFCAYEMGPDSGNAHIIPDSPAKAKAALEKAKTKYELHPILVVKAEDKPGSAAGVCAKIAAKGVNISYCYASGVGKGTGTIVVRTADNGKAKEALG